MKNRSFAKYVFFWTFLSLGVVFTINYVVDPTGLNERNLLPIPMSIR
jgi:hypothetical protein